MLLSSGEFASLRQPPIVRLCRSACLPCLLALVKPLLALSLPLLSPQAFDAYLRELTTKLGRHIEDLEDVKALVAVLREVGWMYVAASSCCQCAGMCCYGLLMYTKLFAAGLPRQQASSDTCTLQFLPVRCFAGARIRGQRGRCSGPH